MSDAEAQSATEAGIPRAEDLLRPVLESAATATIALSDLVSTLARRVNLTPEQRRFRSRSGQLKFDKNVRWATTHLTMAGLLERPAPGRYAITALGRDALEGHSLINFGFLRQFENYGDFLRRSRRSDREIEESEGAEEYAENLPLDVEADIVEDLDPISPYDPKDIRVDPRVYSVRQILDMIDDGELDLAPDFQRLQVWTAAQRSQLIESLLLRIPLPAFYFSSDDEGRLQVVDGVQRLSTIYEFVRGDRFPLRRVEYLVEAEGKRFDDIENTIWSRRIMNTQLTAFVIDPQTPIRVKFDIFRRINTGGTPLSSQEIRHCISRARSRDFLKRLSMTPEFHEATGEAFRNHVRMVDRELALRFAAFRLYEFAMYQQHRSMEEFLGWATAQFDNAGAVNDAVLARLEVEFRRAMVNAQTVFGRHAFRKWFVGSDARHPVNRALFEVWASELARYDSEQVTACRQEIADGARAMLDDPTFIDSISFGTGSPAKVWVRFRAVQTLLQRLLE